MSVESVTLNVLVGAAAIVSLVLLWMALRAWRYARGGRQLALAAAFALLLAKALYLGYGLFTVTDLESLVLTSLVFDLAALFAFYFASLR